MQITTIAGIKKLGLLGATVAFAYTAGSVIAGPAGTTVLAVEPSVEPVVVERIEIADPGKPGDDQGGGGSAVVVEVAGGGGGAVLAGEDAAGHGEEKHVEKHVVIKGIEPGEEFAHFEAREVTWLGLSTEEAPEILTSQLDLSPGVGLVVRYVKAESPAAKAGLQKNDLLISFDGHALAVPSQLRKLVQARGEGDKVKIEYYRGGKKRSTEVTLAKTKEGAGFFLGNHDWEGTLDDLRAQLKDLPFREGLREGMEGLKESLGRLKVDQGRIKDEVRRSLEEAKRAVEKALREAANSREALAPTERALREIEESRALTEKNTTVVVRRSADRVRSVVKSDDEGSIVIVANPAPRLTAHDKSGKLLFDGLIETQEERDKVPRDLWERVEPLFDQLDKKAEDDK